MGTNSLLRTAAAMYLGAQLEGLAWTPTAVPVDLYVNGTFLCAYVLIERVMIDPGRIAIHELKNNGDGGNDQPPEVTGGYLLEWDDGETADHNVLVGADRGWVGIREPEDEDDGSGITATQVDYIDRYLDDVDAALFGANFTDPELGWRQYIDVASAVDYYLAMELSKVDDGNMYGSVMMYKARDTNPVPGDQGELFFGPLWDFDASMGYGTDWVGEDVPGGLIEPTGWYLRDQNPEIEAKQSSVTWFNRLNQDPGFRALVAERWQEVRADLASSDTYLAEQQGLVVESAIRNHMLWEGIGEDEAREWWPAEAAYMRTWLQQRIAWMDFQYAQ